MKDLIDKFAQHRATVGVIGLGYVGLPHFRRTAPMILYLT